MDLRILLIIFLLNSFGEAFRYPPIHHGWTFPKIGQHRHQNRQKIIQPVIPREKALKLIGRFTKILGDLSTLHKNQGMFRVHSRVSNNRTYRKTPFHMACKRRTI